MRCICAPILLEHILNEFLWSPEEVGGLSSPLEVGFGAFTRARTFERECRGGEGGESRRALGGTYRRRLLFRLPSPSTADLFGTSTLLLVELRTGVLQISREHVGS